MYPLTTHPVTATLAVALIAYMLGGWLVAALIGSMGARAVSNRCGGAVCTSQTWLWSPAMRRAR